MEGGADELRSSANCFMPLICGNIKKIEFTICIWRLMENLKRALLVACCVGLATQFQFSLFVPGFIITLSVMVFAIMLYHSEEINPILIACVTGVISPTFRGLLLLPENNFQQVWTMVAPDATFYACYGLLFYKLYYGHPKRDLGRFGLVIFWCDFLSNMVEMVVRTKFFGMTAEMVQMLLIFAFCRTMIVMFILTVVRYYKSFLVKEEHEIRYRNLIMMTSKFKSEIYFMHKNMAEIEDVMKKSFEVYRMVSAGDYPEQLRELTLDIAKDVHEIKKEYIRVIEGLEEISRNKTDISLMNLRDIAALLETDTREHIRLTGLNAEVDIQLATDFPVKNHFYLVSVLKNLMMNALEAMTHERKGELSLSVTEQADVVTFRCKDNGTGIKPCNLSYVFAPGFSTKFDHQSGNIGRGIGLTLVKDLVTDKFGGHIEIDSVEGEGSTFVVTIPVQSFREV